MTYEELKESIGHGRVVLCHTSQQKHDVIHMMLDMGFPASDHMRHSTDIGYPYVGLNPRNNYWIDGWNDRRIGDRADTALYAEEFLALRDKVPGLQSVMSLYE